ncbi:hypothetical protein CPT_Metamorpho_269 [Klebsiella phage Metamorpho]|nr:hypothetical protein CPT_Metamorpho_269 [Klebsiella phage Metamorpho]
MIFVFSAVSAQTGHSFVVTATDTIHQGIDVYNKADLSVCDYGEVKVYDNDGIWVNTATPLPTKGLTSDLVLKRWFKI